MNRHIFLCAAVLAIAGCASPVVGIEKQVSAPFASADHEYILSSGTASIAGQAWLETPAGRITCKAGGARLFPVTGYTRERMKIIYGSSEEGFREAYKAIAFRDDPPDYAKYFRSSDCDTEGRFAFTGLSAGEYYLVAGVISKKSVHALDHGYLMKRVTVTDGGNINVQVHR